MYGQLFKNIFGVVLVLLSSATWSDTEVTIEFSENIAQFTDGRVEPRNLRDKFDCGERIYGVFRLSNLENGERHIATQWKSPGGKVERTNKRRIRISSDDQFVFLSAFIEFASANSLSSIIDPASGIEPYIGQWTVDVIVDKNRIKSGHFQVLC